MRILVVDDKDDGRYYLRALLGAHGFEVDTARHGAEALVKARQAPPQVVISDLLMPVMDGYTLLRYWKADDRLKLVPFIVYTATYTDAEDEQLALDLGADAFILKPAEPEDFLGRLREVERMAASSARVPVHQPVGDEEELLREYSTILIRKLEEKSLQLSETNRSLQQDIAARERAEAALRESEATFRVLTEVMPQLVWMARPDGGNAFCNQRWVDYTGLSVAESEGTGWLRVVHPDDRMGVQLAWRRAIETASTLSWEIRLRTTDGSYRWWLTRGHPLRDAAGGILRWFGTCTDIDELKAAYAARDRAEREASERAAVMAALFESVPDIVTRLDLEGRIQLVNRVPPWIEREQLLGRSWVDAAPPELREAMRRTFEAVVTNGTPASFEASVAGEDRATRTYWTTISPVVRDGQISGAVVVARDITERKQTEAQLIVADRMASVGTLAAGVAHEINNPLASISANLAVSTEQLETLSRSYPVPADLLDALHDAREGAERVRLIVRDLKIFSRGEDVKRGPVDVEAVLESTLRMAWNELRHRARLVRIFGGVPPVEANESRLGQVFLNLVVNAAQAIAEGDYTRNEIRVETRHDRARQRVVVSISDTGTGIPPEVQARLFTPFLTTKPVGVGTGLGLSICHRIVTSIGGTIEFTSEVGKGTTFRVALLVAGLGVETPAPIEPSPVAARRRGRILVIDDEAMITSTVQRVLSMEHDVEVSHSAAEAMGLFQRGERYDAVLCDLMMPQVTGMDLYAALARLDPRQAAKVVFMTGGAFTPKARAFLDDVRNQRLEKPFDVQGLRAVINAMVV